MRLTDHTYALEYQLVEGFDLSSELIAWFGGGRKTGLSHWDMRLRGGALLGARSDTIRPLGGGPPIKPGVRIRPPGYERWRRRVVVRVPCTREQYHRFWEFGFRQIGKPYAGLEIAAFILGEDWVEPGHWFCDALGTVMTQHAGRMPKLYLPYHELTPNGAANALMAIGGKIIEEELNTK